MILYFSGTGNSRYISEVINSVIDDEIVSMNTCLKAQQKFSFTSNKPYVIVCPTYAWQIPRIVEAFIKKTDFKGNKKVYFVLTCGSGFGNAEKYVKKLAMNKDLEYMGIKGILMPENFITMFKAPDRHKAKKIINNAVEVTLSISKLIKKEVQLERIKYRFGSIIASSLINKIFYPLFVKADGFYVNDKCSGCNKCQLLCPLNNINIVNDKPVWNNQCSQCMACIGSCPRQAIEYKNKTQGKTRYYLNQHYRK